MISTLLRRPFLAGLAFLAVALAVLLAFEIGEATRSRIPTGPARIPSLAQSKLLPPITPTPVDQSYPETVARPLFTPTRRPAPAQAVTAAPAFNRGQFQLLGVIIAGNTKTAMLKEKASGRIHRVEVGRELNGMKVATIDREAVTLSLGAESETVPLQVQKAAAAAPHVGGIPAGPFAQAPGAPPVPQAVPPPQVPQVTPPPVPPAPPTAQLSPGTAAFLGINPPAGAAPQPAAPLSPEELLARRRARREQTNP